MPNNLILLKEILTNGTAEHKRVNPEQCVHFEEWHENRRNTAYDQRNVVYDETIDPKSVSHISSEYPSDCISNSNDGDEEDSIGSFDSKVLSH